MSARRAPSGLRSRLLVATVAVVIGLFYLAALSASAFLVPANPVGHHAPTSPIAEIEAPHDFHATIISADGTTRGTRNQFEPHRGLSLVKLYITEYVLRHGSDEDRHAALEMLRTSDDGTATRLYAAYPMSIADVAQRYGLATTFSSAHWGHVTTSMADVTRFVHTLVSAPGHSPILEAMATAYPIAADGYTQDFGTSVLPGAIGTKWGWDDDKRRVHASVSFGTGYTAATFTYGDAARHTDLTLDALGDVVEQIGLTARYRL